MAPGLPEILALQESKPGLSNTSSVGTGLRRELVDEHELPGRQGSFDLPIARRTVETGSVATLVVDLGPDKSACPPHRHTLSRVWLLDGRSEGRGGAWDWLRLRRRAVLSSTTAMVSHTADRTPIATRPSYSAKATKDEPLG